MSRIPVTTKPLSVSGWDSDTEVPGGRNRQDSSSAGRMTFDAMEWLRWGWRVLWRGKLILLGCLILVMAPTVIYLQQARPLYTATAEVLVDTADAGDTLLERSYAARSRLTDSVVMTEAEVLSSNPLIERVVDKLRLDQDPEFNVRLRTPTAFEKAVALLNPISWIPEDWRAGTADQASLSSETRARLDRARIVSAVHRGLSVKAQRRTFVITLQFTSESREKAARIANALTEVYLLDHLEQSLEDTRRLGKWLAERLDSLRSDVAVADAAAEEFRAANGLRREGDRKATMLEQQSTELNSRLVLARADLAQKQARLEQVGTLARGQGGVASSYDVLQSALIQHLREQETAKARELSDLAVTYGERHPRLVGMRADLAELRGKIQHEIDKIAAAVANEVKVASAGVRTLANEIAELRQKSNTSGGAEVRLHELERQAESSRTIYEAFLTRFKREAEQDQIQRAKARVLSPADVPVQPSFPQKPMTLLLAALLALMAGGSLVFLLERLNNLVRSGDEAEDLTGVPTLAMIPALSRKIAKGPDPERTALRKPRSAFADALRSLRTALLLSEDGLPRGRVTMVTSSAPKEGKSFVTLCLARTFARSQARVLLVDADVHRPRLHTALSCSGDIGLAQVLSGEAELDAVLQREPDGEFDFLPAGTVATGREEILRGPAIEQLFKELAARYDRVVIDTPPVLAVADTRVLAAIVDQLIFLIRWNSTPRDAIRNSIRLLREAKAPLVGVAVVQVDQRRHARYGYGDYGQYYGSYHEYYAD